MKLIQAISHFTGLLLVVIVLICCNNGNGAAADGKRIDSVITTSANQDLSIPGSFSNQAQLKFDSTQIKSFLSAFSNFKVFEKDIYRFYQNRQYAYAWFDDKGLLETAANLYNRITNISDEGLPDKILYKEKFTALMEEMEGSTSASPSLELMLTCQYLFYAKNVWQGLSESKTQELEWLLPRKKLSYLQLLDSLAGSNILTNEPVFRQYHLLKEQLKKLRVINETNRLSPIKTDRKKLLPGDTSTAIAAIRNWLFVMGDLASDNKSIVFDETLAAAVTKFQVRMGLKADTVIGPAVISEMNVPIKKRMESIMVNMERSRWVPDRQQKNYLLVNIPDYKLFVIENDSTLFTMKVVVGKRQHKTAVFNGEVKYVVFSPYWNVPSSILRKEILPAMRRNRNYLSVHQMEWYDGKLRQKPGPNNSLGLVKFLFPNSHSIYLHDSPAKSLFNETNRAFSHGCIRVSEAKKLASYLLRYYPAWNDSSITAAMHAGKELTVPLKNTVPVFIAYFTAWVDRQGVLNFRKDVYDRDSRLIKMILEKPTL